MRQNTRRPGCRGFTLIELLVVISIIALLLGILAPSLGSARRSAQGAACMSNTRQLVLAGYQWALDHKGELVGAPFNSARDLLNDPMAEGVSVMTGLSSLATQPHDWAGPLAFGGYLGEMEAPRRRDERFAILTGTPIDEPTVRGGPLPVFSCPSNIWISVPSNGPTVYPEGISGTWFQPRLSMSYTAALNFLWTVRPGGRGNPRPQWARDGFWGQTAGTLWYPNFSSLKMGTYAPRMERIGAQPATKIMLADGARFLRADLPVMNNDVSARAGYGGSFADNGAWEVGGGNGQENTRAWPLGRNAVGLEMSSISLRHGGRAQGQGGDSAGNVGFYDGHVERMSISELRRPDYWLPTGASVQLSRIWEPLRAEYQNRGSGSNDPGGQFGFGFAPIW